MKKWIGRIAKSALVVAVALCAGIGAMTWYGNRDMPAPTLAEHQASYQRAVAWIRANEARVLQDQNSALWWMIQTAADRTADGYLKGLVQQHLKLAYGGSNATQPWKRLIDPKAEVELDTAPLRALEPYQRFLYHAVTCQAVSLDDHNDTNDFFGPKLCHPVATQVFMKDAACSTHQLMGVKLFQRAQCATTVDMNQLQASLVDDIADQLRWDNVLMKDAYIQRVLVLYWVGSGDRIKPAWMRRVLSAQQADGGWVGIRHLPELPDSLQPWRVKSSTPPTNFHATAQGLLLSALAISQASH